jgi:hypothetical protein
MGNGHFVKITDDLNGVRVILACNLVNLALKTSNANIDWLCTHFLALGQ